MGNIKKKLLAEMGGGGRVFTPKYNVLVHCTYLRKKYYIFKRVFSVRKGDLEWNG